MNATKARTSPPPGVLARCVSAEVRAEMAVRRMTGQGLARAMQMSQNYVSTRLRDERDFSLDDVDAIAAAFELDPAELVARAYAVHAERAMLEVTRVEKGGLVVAKGDEAINLFEAKAPAGSRRRPPESEPR